MMTPDLVDRMGIPQKEWRHRQKIWRKELPVLMAEFKISAEELVVISDI